MTTEEFTWWLHGWAEINGGAAPTPEQWQIINDHLGLVFNKVTPDRKVGKFVPYITSNIAGVPNNQIIMAYSGDNPKRTDIPYKTYTGDAPSFYFNTEAGKTC